MAQCIIMWHYNDSSCHSLFRWGLPQIRLLSWLEFRDPSCSGSAQSDDCLMAGTGEWHTAPPTGVLQNRLQTECCCLSLSLSESVSYYFTIKSIRCPGLCVDLLFSFIYYIRTTKKLSKLLLSRLVLERSNGLVIHVFNQSNSLCLVLRFILNQ